LGLGDGLDGTVKTGRLIPGEGPTASARDASYRLGWAGYALFRKTKDGLFEGQRALTIQTARDSAGKVVVGAFQEDASMMQGAKFGQISTAGVTACSVIMIKKADQYAMLHLDAAHTMEGEAKAHLLEQMSALFGGPPPGEIQIMESIRDTTSTEKTFCEDLETALGQNGNTLKVQCLDRSQGKDKDKHVNEDPSGHLEIGLTPQDVVFGDRGDLTKDNGDLTKDSGVLQVRPIEWRLGASQDAVDAIWCENNNSYQDFTSMEAAQAQADRVAKAMEQQMNAALDGAFPVKPEGRDYPGRAALAGVQGTLERLAPHVAESSREQALAAQAQIDREEGRTRPPQAEETARTAQAEETARTRDQAARSTREQAAPEREQAAPEREQAAPEREHINQQQLRAEVGRPERQPERRAPERADAEPRHERAAAGKGR
jgi:flagellar biosynthesis GTPase FlhF